MNIAFYAPLKSPRHPVPSGDRRMGQLLFKALEKSGLRPEIISDFRSFNKNGDADIQKKIETDTEKEIKRLIEHFEKHKPPQLWFTYHLYHKAPDLIGPEICRHFNIPYCLAEASYAPKQKKGPWARGLALTEKSLNLAACVFSLNPDDNACIRQLLPESTQIVPLLPFLDITPFISHMAQQNVSREIFLDKYNISDLDPEMPWAVTVAMMRSGDKTKSYEELAEIWKKLNDLACPLFIIGDGPNQDYIKNLFIDETIEYPVYFLGEQETEEIAKYLPLFDLFIWPGVNEAFGLAMLEAQAAGLPVISASRRGIANFVYHRQTGLLAPEHDIDKFIDYIVYTLDNTDFRHQLAHNAEIIVKQRHSIEAAASFMRQYLPI